MFTDWSICNTSLAVGPQIAVAKGMLLKLTVNSPIPEWFITTQPFIRNRIYGAEYSVKLTYSNVDLKKISGGNTLDPHFRGSGEGRERRRGRGDGEGRVGGKGR